jgi:hypothetical protein
MRKGICKDALPPGAAGALVRMIAMSQLDAPYEGLRVIAGQCDRGSLSDFAWSLYRLWEARGRPSKEAWAMHSLGYFGDDTVAAMDSDRALGHLSALARNTKSTPLRTHAAAALDHAAAARGLLPEQLDDLLAPGTGRPASPARSRLPALRRGRTRGADQRPRSIGRS